MEAWRISHSNSHKKLRGEQIENAIRAAEHAARTYITLRLHKSEVEDLEITVEVETDGDLSFSVEVNLDAVQDKDIYQGLVEGAVEAAHAAIKNELDKQTSLRLD